MVSTGETAFVPSFRPFKPERRNTAGVEKNQQEEWEEFGAELTKDTYPYGYGWDADPNHPTYPYKERFRSQAEIEWAEAFDRLGLLWEYEPMKFDMGAKYFSYTPDFRVTGLSVPDSGRALYIEIKRFPDEEMYLTKYVRFTAWYNCDLLVLAHEQCDIRRKRGDVLKPKNQRYLLILRCPHCNNCDWLPCDDLPTHDYKLSDQDQYFATALSQPPHEPCVCAEKPERIVVPNYFLIQAGEICTQRLLLPDTSGGGISYVSS